MSISQSIVPHLPLLRRYARALTGNQERGDRYVAASLEAILQAPNEFPRNTTPRVGLYQIFQKIWSASQAPFEAPAHDANGDGDGREAIAQRRLAALTPRSRQALLLTATIGRASCRESVCRYVSIPVGAVSLKKKKKETKNTV